MPYICLFRSGRSDEDRRALRACLAERAGAIFTAPHAPRRALAMVAIDEPPELALQPGNPEPAPPYDLVIKAEYPDRAAVLDNVRGSGLVDLFKTVITFETQETIKKGAPEDGSAGALPGVRMLHPLRFHADMPASAVRRSWDIHGYLAVKAHSGASYYAQQWVSGDLQATPTGIGGFSEFQFPSREALVEKFFDSDAARVAVRHDIRHFLAQMTPRLFAQAHWLEAG